MDSVGGVTSSGSFPKNLPSGPSDGGTKRQEHVPPDAPAGFVSPGGIPPERAPGQRANASFGVSGRQAPADLDPFEQLRSELGVLGFDDDDVDEIILKRPEDAMSTLDMLAKVTDDIVEPGGIKLAHYLTPSQLIMLATSCGASGLRAIHLSSNDLGGRMLPKVAEELTKFGNGFEPSLSYRPERLVRIAATHGPEALTALREHSEKLKDFGYLPHVLAEVAYQGGADSIEALLAFHGTVYGGHPFSFDELAGIAAKNGAALRTLQHLMREHSTEFRGMSKLDILRKIGLNDIAVPSDVSILRIALHLGTRR